MFQKRQMLIFDKMLLSGNISLTKPQNPPPPPPSGAVVHYAQPTSWYFEMHIDCWQHYRFYQLLHLMPLIVII